MRAGEVSMSQDGAASFPQPRLVHAAHEFEAQMMKELLKPIAAGGEFYGEASESGSNGALSEFAVSALGESLSSAGGLGVAKAILHSFSQSETRGRTFPVAGMTELTGDIQTPKASSEV